MKPRDFFPLLKEAARKWYADDTFQQGAALAYYTVFAIAPILLVALAIASLLFQGEVGQQEITDEVSQTLGPQVGQAIRDTVRYANQTGSGTLATIVGVAILLFGATSVFAQLQTSLNMIWGVKAQPTQSALWGLVRDRLLSFAFVVGTGFLLLVSLLVSAALAALGKWLAAGVFPAWVHLWQVINALISFGAITVLFALIYKILPDVRIDWQDVWVGAAVTAVLFTFGKYLLGLYLGRSSVASAYGAAGSLVVILLWVYYSSQIFLFGAEFTQVYARRSGKLVVPTGNAVAVRDPAQPAQAARDGSGESSRPPESSPDPQRAG